METKEIVLYRHKTNKDFYLIRNWAGLGDFPSIDMLEATDNINNAILNATIDNAIDMVEELEKKQTKSALKAKATEYKHFEIDGYEGTLVKENVFNVDDFEPITLVIKEDLEQKENQK